MCLAARHLRCVTDARREEVNAHKIAAITPTLNHIYHPFHLNKPRFRPKYLASLILPVQFRSMKGNTMQRKRLGSRLLWQAFLFARTRISSGRAALACVAKTFPSPVAHLETPPLEQVRWVIKSPDGKIVPDTRSESPEIAWEKACWPTYAPKVFKAEGWKCVKL